MGEGGGEDVRMIVRAGPSVTYGHFRVGYPFSSASPITVSLYGHDDALRTPGSHRSRAGGVVEHPVVGGLWLEHGGVGM